jgi:hypothetical protein
LSAVRHRSLPLRIIDHTSQQFSFVIYYQIRCAKSPINFKFDSMHVSWSTIARTPWRPIPSHCKDSRNFGISQVDPVPMEKMSQKQIH